MDGGRPFGPAEITYDTRTGGGTTTLEIDRRTGALLSSRAMGRFVHEAVAVDPATGIVYETEDASRSGLYRFLPEVPGRLEEGGRLEMLAVRGAPNYDTRRGQPPGIELEVEWVGIDDLEGTRRSVFDQGAERGGAAFGRLEGAATGRGRSGSSRRATGDVVLCQDGWGPQHVFVLLRDGSVHPFARNNVVLNGERNGIRGDFRWSEFAGSTFSPGGRWLFVNVQEPGITFAITGEWTVAIPAA